MSVNHLYCTKIFVCFIQMSVEVTGVFILSSLSQSTFSSDNKYQVRRTIMNNVFVLLYLLFTEPVKSLTIFNTDMMPLIVVWTCPLM